MLPTGEQFDLAHREIEEDTARRSVAALKSLDGIPTPILNLVAAQPTPALCLFALEEVVKRRRGEMLVMMSTDEYLEYCAKSQQLRAKLVELLECVREAVMGVEA